MLSEGGLSGSPGPLQPPSSLSLCFRPVRERGWRPPYSSCRTLYFFFFYLNETGQGFYVTYRTELLRRKIIFILTDYLEYEELHIVSFVKICNLYSSMLFVLADCDSVKPLEGVRILDLTRFVLGFLQISD